MKQWELGLWPTHLLSATLLILVAMQFSFLSIFNVAEFVRNNVLKTIKRWLITGCLKAVGKLCCFSLPIRLKYTSDSLLLWHVHYVCINVYVSLSALNV